MNGTAVILNKVSKVFSLTSFLGPTKQFIRYIIIIDTGEDGAKKGPSIEGAMSDGESQADSVTAETIDSNTGPGDPDNGSTSNAPGM